MVDEEIDVRTLYEIYFPAFKAAVQKEKHTPLWERTTRLTDIIVVRTRIC